MRHAPTIAVWGHFHGGNLGDELVVATIIDAIKSRVPDARVVAISMAPADVLARHGVRGYPINPRSTTAARSPAAHAATHASSSRIRLKSFARRVPGARKTKILAGRLASIGREIPFLIRSFRLLRSIDRVVVAGSGQLLDEWYGPWWHPYTTFRWAVLARLARTPVHYLSVGAGPIDHPLSAYFIRSAVNSAAYVSVRDRHSARVLASIGVRRSIVVCPDMGYGVPAPLVPERTTDAGRKTIVGLNIMAHQDPRYWPRGDSGRYDAYVQKMATVTQALVDEGFTVRLFSSQTRSDAAVAEDLFRLLPADQASRVESELGSIEAIDDLLRTVAACDVVIAARFHSVLLPLLVGIPVIGLAYNAKTRELLADVGQPDRCLDIDSFEVESLAAAVREIQARTVRAGDGEQDRSRVLEHRRAVERQFDEIFGATTVSHAGRSFEQIAPGGRRATAASSRPDAGSR